MPLHMPFHAITHTRRRMPLNSLLCCNLFCLATERSAGCW